MPWDQLVSLILGSNLVFVGIVAGALAFTRRRGEGWILVWFAILTGVYGGRLLLEATASQAGRSGPRAIDYSISVATYLVLVLALLFSVELTRGAVRRLLQIAVFPALLVAAAGIGFTLSGRSREAFMPLNHGLAVCVLLVLIAVNAVPTLSRRFSVVPSRALAAGSLLFAIVAIYVNLSGFLGLPSPDVLEPPAFAILVLSLGYVTAAGILANEKKLLSIEKELDIARGIQTSVLPSNVPELDGIRVAAAYRPMTAVAGDFYEFIVVDRHRAGFLVADVSGHGVPAALIASMIKVAMQAVIPSAHEPGEVLCLLNRVLSSQLRGQYVTAAYLWMDTEARKARYSAAGHPPLLHWHAAEGELESVESNGLLFGVLPEVEYPVRDFALGSEDRLLLYTDGVVEAQNVKGDFFGDAELGHLMVAQKARPAAELVTALLHELRQWLPTGASQQDDITLVVIDVL